MNCYPHPKEVLKNLSCRLQLPGGWDRTEDKEVARTPPRERARMTTEGKKSLPPLEPHCPNYLLHMLILIARARFHPQPHQQSHRQKSAPAPMHPFGRTTSTTHTPIALRTMTRTRARTQTERARCQTHSFRVTTSHIAPRQHTMRLVGSEHRARKRRGETHSHQTSTHSHSDTHGEAEGDAQDHLPRLPKAPDVTGGSEERASRASTQHLHWRAPLATRLKGGARRPRPPHQRVLLGSHLKGGAQRPRLTRERKKRRGVERSGEEWREEERRRDGRSASRHRASLTRAAAPTLLRPMPTRRHSATQPLHTSIVRPRPVATPRPAFTTRHTFRICDVVPGRI